MTVTDEQIAKAKAAGLKNADIAARVADETGNKFYHICALLEKESMGRNVYGHDAGGALSGFPEEVNLYNFDVFEWLVFKKGQTSNGVGPMQLTFKGFFTDMKKQGLKPYDVHDNMLYGARLWLSYYRSARDAGYSRDNAIKKAGTKYNGSTAYGVALLLLMDKWVGIVGNDDYA